jgi:hypothetical protein
LGEFCWFPQGGILPYQKLWRPMHNMDKFSLGERPDGS